MPKLEIEQHFRGILNGVKFFHYAVYVKVETLKGWKFLQSFFTRGRAEKFIVQVQNQFKRGDYSEII